MSPSLRVSRAITVCVLIALFVGSGVTAVSGQQSASDERPTDNVTQRLTVDVDSGSIATVRVIVAYPARTVDEAAAAENGSLDPPWFQPEERIQKIFDEHADEDDELPNGSVAMYHKETLSGRSPPNSDHGWILLQYKTGWYGYVDPGENLTVDRTYANALDEGWELQIVAPSSWEPATVNGDPVVEPTGHTGTSYTWRVRDDLPDVLLAFDQPGRSTEPEDDIPLGIASGAVFVLVALSLTVLVLIRRQSVR